MSAKILIIDDDVDTLKLVGLMLQKQGYQILAANNGPQGLTKAESEKPDLILLDVMMPAMDGHEVARRLRENQLTADTPILMFTARSQLDDKVSGFASGADDYLTKPTHPTELSAHVKALLTRSIKGKTGTTPLPTEPRAFSIGITAARGGMGVTTLAVNLGNAIRLATRAEVIVAELRPGMGTLGPDMGEARPHALKDLISGSMTEMTTQNVKDKLFNHPTGVQLLCGSVDPRDGMLLNSLPAFEALVNRMSFLAKYLLLDLGAGLTPLAQTLLPACDLVVLIVEPAGGSVTHSKAMMSDMVEMGIHDQRILPVLVNRVRSDTQLALSQVEDQLEVPSMVAITPAPELIYLAGRTKTTALAARPDSLTAQQFTKLAGVILELERQKK